MDGKIVSSFRRSAVCCMICAALFGCAKKSADEKLSNNDFPNPPTQITNALAVVPTDAEGTPEQVNFDLNSWLTFIALNWPADTTTCGPDTSSGQSILSGSSPTVWETYLSDEDVFVAPPATPLPWCNANSQTMLTARSSRIPAAVRLSQKTGVKRFFHHQAKVTHNFSQANAGQFPGIDEAVDGVLTDQNGRFVRYEIRMNYDEYNFITTNSLWDTSGQRKYTQPISFPTTPTGAIEIKAAWKILDAAKGDDPSRFYTTRAIVYNDGNMQPSPGPNPVTLGLVGLHIIHKTQKQPRWIWSTFEHVDNLTKSFNNPNCPQTPPYTANATAPCTTSCCPPNTQTAAKPYTELDASGKPLNQPVQVTRVNAIEAEADSMNLVFQKLLQGTVWANYQLIGTQWVGELGTLPKPPYLANTTLETFNQGPVPPTDGPVAYPNPSYKPFSTAVSSSCMKCHSVAKTRLGANADFSFILGEAQ